MKSKKLFSFLSALFLLAAFSTSGYCGFVIQEDGIQKGIVEKLNVSTNLNVDVSGKTGTLTANGSSLGAAVALTAGTAVTLTVGSRVYTDTIVTDNQNQTITFSGAGTAGDQITIIFTTDTGGSNDEVITFDSALVTSTGTLTLANVTADIYVVNFISDGTLWHETGRTAVQTT